MIDDKDVQEFVCELNNSILLCSVEGILSCMMKFNNLLENKLLSDDGYEILVKFGYFDLIISCFNLKVSLYAATQILENLALVTDPLPFGAEKFIENGGFELLLFLLENHQQKLIILLVLKLFLNFLKFGCKILILKLKEDQNNENSFLSIFIKIIKIGSIQDIIKNNEDNTRLILLCSNLLSLLISISEFYMESLIPYVINYFNWSFEDNKLSIILRRDSLLAFQQIGLKDTTILFKKSIIQNIIKSMKFYDQGSLKDAFQIIESVFLNAPQTYLVQIISYLPYNLFKQVLDSGYPKLKEYALNAMIQIFQTDEKTFQYALEADIPQSLLTLLNESSFQIKSLVLELIYVSLKTSKFDFNTPFYCMEFFLVLENLLSVESCKNLAFELALLFQRIAKLKGDNEIINFFNIAIEESGIISEDMKMI